LGAYGASRRRDPPIPQNTHPGPGTHRVFHVVKDVARGAARPSGLGLKPLLRALCGRYEALEALCGEPRALAAALRAERLAKGLGGQQACARGLTADLAGAGTGGGEQGGGRGEAGVSAGRGRGLGVI
jgi:hypothetical protein